MKKDTQKRKKYCITNKICMVLIFFTLCINAEFIKIYAEEIYVYREEDGGLESFLGLRLSEEDEEKWLRNIEESQKLQKNSLIGTEKEYVFISYGSDYGYRDMAYRSNSGGRQYLYWQLKIGSTQFTLSEETADIIKISNGKEYFAAITIDLTDYDLAANEKLEAYFTFRHDNPQYFWLSNTVLYSDNILIALTYDEYKDGKLRKEVLDEIITTMDTVYLSQISESDSMYQKVLNIHDTLIQDVKYAENTSIPIAHSIAGAMTGEKAAVCEGYAKVMQIIMNACDIENVYVTGCAGGGHAWNLVHMDNGEYYWLDATWDDRDNDAFRHTYFLVGNINFTDHIPDTSSGTGTAFLYDLPAVSDTNYVYQAETEKIISGDINLDGDINIVDLMMCLNHVGRKHSLIETAYKASDVNSDGYVNLTDLMRLLNYTGRRSDIL